MLDVLLYVVMLICIIFIDIALTTFTPLILIAGYVLVLIGLTFYVYLKQNPR